MVSSRIPRVTLDDMGTLAPFRTPGSLGHNDAAAPQSGKGLMADTPGPLGVNDSAGSSRHKPHQKTCQRLPPFRWKLSLQQAQAIALEITTYFEGGGYAALAGDNDQQVTSFGLLQWNFGQNTLGPLLKKMQSTDPVAFDSCFHPDDEYRKFKTALATNDNAGQVQWARTMRSSNRKEWVMCFKKLARIEKFNKVQAEEAVKNFHPAVVHKVNRLRALFPREFQDIELKTYVALYDLSVQQYSLGAALENVRRRLGKQNSKSQNDIMRILVTERGRTARKQYRGDCISRRMGILTAATFKSLESGHTVERKNPKFSLLIKYEGSYVDL